MFNPFDGVIPAIEDPAELIGREEALQELDLKVRRGMNTVLLGVLGSGKTSLLNTYFNFAYCKTMASKHHTIVAQTSFPVFLPCDEVIRFFTDAIVSSLKILKKCGQSERMEAIMEEIREVRADSRNSAGELSEIVQIIHRENGYKILIVLDDFEQFTSSNEVTVAHHNLLRSLMDSIQFVVATNFDLQKDSLADHLLGGSFYLQKFGGNEMLVGGLDEAASGKYLERMTEGTGVSFTKEEADILCDISGGIPVLLRRAAKHAFDRKLTGTQLGQEDFCEVVAKSAEDMRSTLDNWYKLITADDYRVIRRTCDGETAGVSAAELAAQKGLFNRGILVRYQEQDAFGQPVEGYVLNSAVLDKFSEDDIHIRELLSSSEKRRGVSYGTEVAAKPVSGGFGAGKDIWTDAHGGAGQSGVVYQEIHYHAPVTKIEQLNVSGLMAVLDDAQGLRSYMQQIAGRFGQMQLELSKRPEMALLDEKWQEEEHVNPDGGPDGAQEVQEYGCTGAEERETERRKAEAVCEQAIEQFGEELFEEISAQGQEEETLNLRFERVRGVHPELTDELIGSMSEKAQLYLKIAVVVEEALKVLDILNAADFSAQQIMYGKVFEQVMKDSFYGLFHEEPSLCVWDYSSRKMPGERGYDAAQTFGAKTEKNTMLGAYGMMLEQKKEYLSLLAMQCQMECPGGLAGSRRAGAGQWNTWWDQLSKRVEHARKLRNYMAHTDHLTTHREVRKLFGYLFGKQGIVESCLIGRQLYQNAVSDICTEEKR